MKKTREEREARDLDELFERYRQAPDSYVFVPLADAYRKIGRFEEALDICEEGVRRHPAYPSGHVVKGKCLFDKGDKEGARGAFERVLMLDENNLVALKYLGMIEADSGDLCAAQGRFRHILTLDPENKEIKAILRIVDEQNGPDATPEPSGADIMEGVDEILRGGAESVDRVAGDESAPDVAAEAAASLDGAGPKRSGEELETSDELASVTLADIFASQGYKSKAEKIYRQVLRRQPESEAVRRRLHDLVANERDADSRGDDGVFEDIAPVREACPEVVEQLPTEAPASFAERAGEERTAPVSSGAPDSSAAAVPGPVRIGTEATPGDARAEISEKDSLGHFRRWLTRMQK